MGVTIYALIDLVSEKAGLDRVRYIGQTSVDIERRLTMHARQVSLRNPREILRGKDAWMFDARALGRSRWRGRIGIVALAVVEPHMANETERAFIAHFRGRVDLLNLTSGGAGTLDITTGKMAGWGKVPQTRNSVSANDFIERYAREWRPAELV